MFPVYKPPIETRPVSERFAAWLRSYDEALEAVRDLDADRIYIFARRKGLCVHELTIKREFGELWTETEGRARMKIKECDVWKRFKSGREYDDYLANEEEKFRLQKKKENKNRRLAILKEERRAFEAALWNAQHGRLTKETALPYNYFSNIKSTGKVHKFE